MSVADWLIVAAVLLSVVQAAAQGFFLEAFSLAGVIVGFLVAAWGYSVVSRWFAGFVSLPWIADIAGFLAIFVVIVLLAGAAGRIVSWGVREAGLRWVDRILGAAFGLVRGFLVVTVVVLAMTAFAPSARLLVNSNIAPYLLVVGRAATWLTPADIRNRVRDGIEVLRRTRPQSRERGSPVADWNRAS